MSRCLILTLYFVDVILSKAPPGGNPLLRGLVSQRPTAGRPPADKGKRPRVEPSAKVGATLKNIEPLTVVVPSPQQRSAPVQGSPRHKKRKDKEHQKDKSVSTSNNLFLLLSVNDPGIFLASNNFSFITVRMGFLIIL